MTANDTGKPIKIVYYLYLVPDANWKEIASGQLRQLKNYGILNEADLYIHICDCHGLVAEAESLIKDIVPSALLNFSYENRFEYPGIKLVYDLAKQHPEAIFIYFHAKGVSHQIQLRSAKEVTLFTLTFKNWRKNIQLLNKNGIQKVGLFPAMLKAGLNKPGELGGWIWYNYWYATGKYLSQCPQPMVHKDRYYYEGWLGLHNADNTYITNDCASIYKIGLLSKTYFGPSEADHHLSQATMKRAKTANKIAQVFYSPLFAHVYFKAKNFKRAVLSQSGK
jgi:hypothetical protein